MAIDDDTVTPAELPPIVEQAAWVEHLPAIITEVLLEGGPEGQGPMNFQARVIDARLRFLKGVIETIQAEGLGGVDMKGVLATEAELDAIPTEGLAIGTAYFLNWAMRVWNGTIWASSGSLRGAAGLNLLGQWPNLVPLPEVEQRVIGDAYLWKNDIWVLVPNLDQENPDVPVDTPPVWESMGIRGADGKSTFDIYREQPGNADKTQAEFLASQKGETGANNYELWLTMPGNAGKSMEEWFEATRGETGSEGPPKAAFTVAGAQPNIGSLPTPGDENKAWYVGIDLYVWVDANNAYIMIPGIRGESAYQIWLKEPEHEGQTEAQFVAWMKGPKGDDSTEPGPRGFPGKDGRNLRVLGTVANEAALNTIQDPVDQDAYVTMDTGRLWMYLPDEGGWKDLGPWRGLDGKSAFEVWKDDGHPEGTLQQFWASLKGADGLSMKIRGVVATLADLPNNPEEQWIYAVQDERSFYLYLDGGWADLGTYGKDGKDGLDGKSLDIIKILTEEDQVPPVANEASKGKAYLSWNPRDVYFNISGNAWQNAGPFTEQGEQGIQGTAWRPKGTVLTLNDLPLIGPQNGRAKEGDAYSVVSEDKAIYSVVDGQWSGPLNITGPAGGDGPKGNPGALMPILGVFQTVAELEAAVPTGNLGDAYLIVDNTVEPKIRDLAIWDSSGSVWVNTGPAGIPGAEGKQGEPGKDSTVPGPVGSQWLTLDTQDAPSVAFNGRPGDWAVNKLNRIYFKTVNQGWIYWGQLVAGDVNSPLESEGKVVRLGDRWIPLPIDAVVDPEDGAFYGRQKTGEVNGNPVTAWAKLPKNITDLTTQSDTAQWVRVWKTASQVPVWAEIQFPEQTGITDPANPTDDGLYLRFAKNKSWVLYKPAPTTAGFQYVQKGGEWVAFDGYDLPILALSATTTVNVSNNQVVALDNTGSAAKTITLTDGPKAAGQVAARAKTVVVTVKGAAGLVTFAASGSTALGWNKGNPPVMSGTLTNVIFWWTGTQWMGQEGAVVP